MPEEDLPKPFWKSAHVATPQKEALPATGLDKPRDVTRHRTPGDTKKVCYALDSSWNNQTLKGTRETQILPPVLWDVVIPLPRASANLSQPPHQYSSFPGEPQTTRSKLPFSRYMFCQDPCKQSKANLPCTWRYMTQSDPRLFFQGFKPHSWVFKQPCQLLHYGGVRQTSSAFLGASPPWGIKSCTQPTCSIPAAGLPGGVTPSPGFFQPLPSSPRYVHLSPAQTLSELEGVQGEMPPVQSPTSFILGTCEVTDFSAVANT